MTSLHVFLLLSLAVAIYGLRQNPATRHIREAAAGDVTEDTDVGDIIEAANANMGRARGGPHVEYGDIAVSHSRNAHPCARRGCLWPRRNGRVTIPVYISRRYSRGDFNTIIRGLVSFHRSTCVRFVWRRWQRDYLYFFPGSGCWSYLGRQRGLQPVSLRSRGCIYHGTIQHEVLHALGFTHEQNRSDRDKHVTIITQNIQAGKERNFRKVDTNNLYTPYDYNSVMHYSRYAFSKERGRLATIVPKPDASVTVGGAREMSRNDILRVNRLYCR